MTAEKLDEASLRRADFTNGVPVVLADGQEWWLRRPFVRFTFGDNPEGVRFFPTFGDRLDTYHPLYRALEAAEGSEQVIGAELRLASAILLRNYDLSLEQVGSLMQFGYREHDEEGQRIRREVMAVAAGQSPRPDAEQPAEVPAEAVEA